MHSWPHKDPNEVLDYGFVWTDRLETGETLVSSTFLEDAANTVVIDSEDTNGDTTVVWLSGGTAGTLNLITNRVVTSLGRTYDETARLRVRAR